MTDLNINYIPIDKITKTIEYTQMSIKIIKHNIGDNKAEIRVDIYDSKFENMKTFMYLIDNSDYLLWTTDNYIIELCKSKLSQEVF